MHLNLLHNSKNKYRNSPFSNDHIYHTMFQQLFHNCHSNIWSLEKGLLRYLFL